MYKTPEPILEWNRACTGKDTSLFVSRLIVKGLTDEQIITVLVVLESICTHCWDHDDVSCYCWNDE